VIVGLRRTEKMAGRVELLGIFQKTAAEIVEREFPNISEKTAISELGIDSLGMLEIVGSMERELKIQLPDEALAGIQTVEDLLNLVEKKSGSVGGSGA
jgi:acyl carrier protein